MEDHIGYSLGEDENKKDVKEVVIKLNPPRITEVSKLQCHVCHKIMGHRSSLYKHLKYVHKIEPAHRLPISCREKDCDQSFTFIDPFRRHLAEQHGFNVVVEKYVFRTMADFFNWKKLTEDEENLRFIVSTGPRHSKGGKTHYYRCQKNGAYKPEIKKRLQSDDPKSVYNMSTTHCIASMFVFEEPECVTVEFCRTHYGHELSNKVKPKKEYVKTYTDTLVSENSLIYETVDSYSKLKSLLSEKDKSALLNILNENQHLLLEAEELFYENERDVVVKIPLSILKTIVKENDIKKREVESDFEPENDETVLTMDSIPTEGEESCDEAVIEKLEDEETDNENSTILKSLGNGVFLDPTSNKRLKLDSFLRKTRCKEFLQLSEDSLNEPELKTKEREESEETLVTEYLNELDEKVYVLGLIKEEDTVVRKREKILSQLQTILMMVNSENDMQVLNDIQNHLSKYALPQ